MSMDKARGWGVRAPLLALAAGLLATGAWGQADQRAVAKLKQLSGNVLVSREAGLAAGSEAQALVNGTRVITTANSEVVVVFDDGCEIRLKENERLDVDSGRPCAAMVPESLAVAPPVPGAPLAGRIIPGVMAATALWVYRDNRRSSSTPPVSPN